MPLIKQKIAGSSFTNVRIFCFNCKLNILGSVRLMQCNLKMSLEICDRICHFDILLFKQWISGKSKWLYVYSILKNNNLLQPLKIIHSEKKEGRNWTTDRTSKMTEREEEDIKVDNPRKECSLILFLTLWVDQNSNLHW